MVRFTDTLNLIAQQKKNIVQQQSEIAAKQDQAEQAKQQLIEQHQQITSQQALRSQGLSDVPTRAANIEAIQATQPKIYKYQQELTAAEQQLRDYGKNIATTESQVNAAITEEQVYMNATKLYNQGVPSSSLKGTPERQYVRELERLQGDIKQYNMDVFAKESLIPVMETKVNEPKVPDIIFRPNANLPLSIDQSIKYGTTTIVEPKDFKIPVTSAQPSFFKSVLLPAIVRAAKPITAGIDTSLLLNAPKFISTGYEVMKTSPSPQERIVNTPTYKFLQTTPSPQERAGNILAPGFVASPAYKFMVTTPSPQERVIKVFKENISPQERAIKIFKENKSPQERLANAPMVTISAPRVSFMPSVPNVPGLGKQESFSILDVLKTTKSPQEFKPIQTAVTSTVGYPFVDIEKAYVAEVAAGREPGRTKFFTEKLGQGYKEAFTGISESYFQLGKGNIVSPFIGTTNKDYQYLPESKLVGGAGNIIGQSQLYVLPVVGKSIMIAPFAEAASRKELIKYIQAHPIETTLTAAYLGYPVVKYLREPQITSGWKVKPKETISYVGQLKKVPVTKQNVFKYKLEQKFSKGSYYTYNQPRYRQIISEIFGKETTPINVLSMTPKQLKSAGIKLDIKTIQPKTVITQPQGGKFFDIKKPYYAEEFVGKSKVPRVYYIEPTKDKAIYLGFGRGNTLLMPKSNPVLSTKLTKLTQYVGKDKVDAFGYTGKEKTVRTLLYPKLRRVGEVPEATVVRDISKIRGVSPGGKVEIVLAGKGRTMRGYTFVFKEPVNFGDVVRSRMTYNTNRIVLDRPSNINSLALRNFRASQTAKSNLFKDGRTIKEYTTATSVPTIKQIQLLEPIKTVTSLETLQLTKKAVTTLFVPSIKLTKPVVDVVTKTDVVGKTLLGTVIISKNLLDQPTKLSTPQKQISQTIQIPKVDEVTKQIPRVFEVTKQTPKLIDKQIQVPGQIFKQIPDQIFKQIPKQVTKETTKQIPKEIPIKPVPPFIFFPESNKRKSKLSKSFGLSNKAYQAYIRRRGKFSTIGSPTTEGRALELGTKVARRTLARTFGIKEAGTTTQEDIVFNVPSGEFRLPKRPTGFGKSFVQVKALTRGSGEVGEILSFKKKGILKTKINRRFKIL